MACRDELRGHPERRHVRLSLQGESVRHVLVSRAFALSGTNRSVWADRDRATRRRATACTIASTSCCFPIGPTCDPERIFCDAQEAKRLFQLRQAHGWRFLRGCQTQGGWSQTMADRRMWGEMRMNPTDMLDVSGYAYTYLMNGVDARRATGRACSRAARRCGCDSSMARR